MNEFNPNFKIYASSPQEAQEIQELFIHILNNVTPKKLASASAKVKKNPNLIRKLLNFI